MFVLFVLFVHVEAHAIAGHITAGFERTVHRANPAEVTSWRNSRGEIGRVKQ
jgi:hypothetical protein